MEAEGYEYILGARLKSHGAEIRERVLSLGLRDGESGSVELAPGRRMVVTMSAARSMNC